MTRKLSLFSLFIPLLLLAGCATNNGNVDYSAFRESKPASILVLPPLNESIDPAATAGVLAQATLPLAESGYYVVPVAVMTETFRNNGLDTAGQIHEIDPAKLHEIFCADAALYLTVTEYGASYRVLNSTVTVALSATLVDLRSGAKLWEGSQEVKQASGDAGLGLLGALVNAVVSQIASDLSDKAYDVAGVASQSLLSANRPGGMLYGPRSPHYELH